MKLSCTQEDLDWGLGVVGRAAAAKSPLPITNNILLVADQTRLRLTATNLEMTISCWISAKIEEEGAITLPAKLLTNFVSALPNGELKINPVGAMALELRCAKSKARLNGVAAKDFPKIPAVDEGITIEVKAEVLCKGISHVSFAASTELSRPILSGVGTIFEGKSLTLAGTDGFRLAEYKLPTLTETSEKVGIVIPARVLAELNQLLAGQEGVVEITVDPKKGQILFRFEKVELISQLLQGAFPAYTSIIPKSHTTQATVNTADFLMAVRTAAFFADDEVGTINLVMAPGKVVVSAQSKEVGNNVSEVDAEIEGDEAEIFLGGKYLADAFNALDGEQAILQVTEPMKPAVIREVGTDNYTYVIMPVFRKTKKESAGS